MSSPSHDCSIFEWKNMLNSNYILLRIKLCFPKCQILVISVVFAMSIPRKFDGRSFDLQYVL